MNWEVDVFGSIRNRVKAEKENFAASKEEYNAAMVSPLRSSSLLLHQYEGTATRGKGSATELPLPTDGRTDHPETV